MDKVFQGWAVGAWNPPSYYISEAERTSVVVDGVTMVRVGESLDPITKYVGTKTEAKQQIVDRLVRYVGEVQATIDRLKDEILHETLTTEERAA